MASPPSSNPTVNTQHLGCESNQKAPDSMASDSPDAGLAAAISEEWRLVFDTENPTGRALLAQKAAIEPPPAACLKVEAVSGEDSAVQENPPHIKKAKRGFRRHTSEQIQELEAVFKDYPHPDEKQRAALSKRLRLEPRQIKFWFQNKRTQTKALMERRENAMLRQENEKLLAENATFRAVMRNPLCSSCSGGGPAAAMAFEEEERLKMENAWLRDELERVCAHAGKSLGRPISLELPVSPIVPAGASSPLSTVLQSPTAKTSPERSAYVELAMSAMDELMKMAQLGEPLWVPSMGIEGEKLNYEEYYKVFPRCVGTAKPAESVLEATRTTGIAIIHALDLVEALMDRTQWAEMFPGLVASAAATDVICSGVGGTRNGMLQFMQAELQVLSPLVPLRSANFLRFCKQLADSVWAVVDVSIDGLGDIAPAASAGSTKCRRLPSGCMIQDMPNGYSKVTWMEHAEYDEAVVHPLYRALLRSGRGLGARRWLSMLQRYCEGQAVTMSSSFATGDPTAAVITADGRRSVLRLVAWMTSNFCAGLCASLGRQEWRRLSVPGIGENVRVMTRQSGVGSGGEMSGLVLSAATSVWLPVTHHRLFDFLRDVHLRSKWDILSNGGPMQEMAHIAKGPDPGNAVSLLSSTASFGGKQQQGSSRHMLILQETCSDAAGSTVVYASVDVAAMHIVLAGGDPACVALLPSGFAVLPDGEDRGSLLTVGFQILVNSLPTAKLTVESVETVNSLISCTVQKIKAALGCCHDNS